MQRKEEKTLSGGSLMGIMYPKNGKRRLPGGGMVLIIALWENKGSINIKNRGGIFRVAAHPRVLS